MANIAIISCVKTKRKGKMRAKDLYYSPLFKFSYAYTNKHYDRVIILSTLYGALDTNDEIEYYELTLNKMNAQQKRAWAYKVATQLKTKIQTQDTLHYFCGLNYRRELIKQLPNKYTEPLKGLGMGRQLQWYKRHLND